MKKIFTLLRWYVVALMVISLSVSALSGIVLCSGTDGHLRFELADHNCRGEAEDSDNHSPVAGVNAEDADGCDSCVDLPLYSGTERISISLEKFKCRLSAAGCLPYIFAMMNSCIDVAGYARYQSFLAADLLQHKSSLTILRSTVLRV